MEFLKRIQVFADSSLPASWLVHTGGALLMVPVIGAFPTVVFFVLREAEQAYHAAASGRGEPWYDYPLDVVGPLLVVVVWTLIRGPVLLG